MQRPQRRFEAFQDGFPVAVQFAARTRSHRGRGQASPGAASLHCGERLHKHDRAGIEQIYRYGARGPLTLGKLSKDDDGRHRYCRKRTVAGKMELVMTSVASIGKLAVLVPTTVPSDVAGYPAPSTRNPSPRAAALRCAS